MHQASRSSHPSHHTQSNTTHHHHQLANVMNGLGKLGYSPISTAATTNNNNDDDGAGGDGLAFLRAFREQARREVGRFAPQVSGGGREWVGEGGRE